MATGKDKVISEEMGKRCKKLRVKTSCSDLSAGTVQNMLDIINPVFAAK